MKFSLLMSIYINEKPRNFDECLNSILNQSLLPNEIIIVKDGPLTKALDKIIDKYVCIYPNIFRVFSYPLNEGLGKRLNEGINLCRYNIIARMDTDDICVKDRFKMQIDYLKKHSEVDILGGYVSEFDDETRKELSIRKVALTNDEIKKYAKMRSPFNHPTVMFKKDAVLKSGNYLPFHFKEDYYLWARMIKENCIMANLDTVLVNMRVSRDLYKRRGGLKFIAFDFKLQLKFLSMGLINIFHFIINLSMRIVSALLPNRVRRILYIYGIRKV